MQIRKALLRAGRPAADLLLLTWAAGMTDALIYIQSGVFPANMTGNTVVLGLGLTGTRFSRTLLSAVSLGCFIAGAAIAGFVLARSKKPDAWESDMQMGLGLELPFLAAFAALWALSPVPSHPWLSMALVATSACGLGIQSVAVRRLKIAGVATTFITGTITSAVMSLASKTRPTGEPQSGPRHSSGLLAGVFLTYLLAAGTGAALAQTHVTAAAAVPLAIVAAAALRAL